METLEKPSKTARKRAMDDLQTLGVELVTLSKDQLKKIDLPEKLGTAVRDAQRITQHEAHRRQLQYIGKLMRLIDAEPIRAALDDIKGVSAAANARMHALESLRTRFLEDETVIGEIAVAHPDADLQLLRQLRRNALKEQQLTKPPRAFRELFRVLRELSAATESPEEPKESND
ncbi:MAG: ribosome biogenesis factor YjgA [Rhodocyclaceae bacterium]|nr:ribosome biogenesis factor YjgA [Rhodocyclaceae bacterium]